MRIFFLATLISASAFSQATRPDGFCDENTLTNPAGDLIYDCDTLTIGAGTHVIPNLAPPQYLDITVAGNVTIAAGAVIVLRGGNGGPASDITAGGAAGPGGYDGGDNTNFGPNDAPEDPAPDNGGGDQGVSDAVGVCGGGGGGGGFSVAGNSGSSCVNSAGGLGGNAYTNLATAFRGGFGGGAGGTASLANPILSATGGGGAGAILINAAGDVTINGNIDVRGGNGGAASAGSKSGGGGGGSGGAIRIIAGGALINNGTFLLAGGNGGSGSAPGARGGNGSPGIYDLQDSDNVIYGTGTGGNGINPLATSSTQTLKSSISCGTVNVKNHSLMLQMITGFMMMLGLSKIRGRFRRSV